MSDGNKRNERKTAKQIAVLCNGSTADSDSVCLGSNPGTAAKMALSIQGLYRGVAQLGRALRSGRRSRRFKSSHLDHNWTPVLIQWVSKRVSSFLFFLLNYENEKWLDKLGFLHFINRHKPPAVLFSLLFSFVFEEERMDEDLIILQQRV